MKIEALVFDTNVPMIANETEESRLECALKCVLRIRGLFDSGLLVLDSENHILGEYLRNLKPLGQPGVGHAFARWVVENQFNPDRCERVTISSRNGRGEYFADFPDTPTLKGFDRSDRKFVATARKSKNRPTIVHASDRGWRRFRAALSALEVAVEDLCPTAPSIRT